MRISLPTVTVLLLATACTRETPSAIVQFAKQNGSGDLSGSSDLSRRIWLRHHPDVALKLQGMCRALRPGDATWSATTEGQLCTSVSRAAFYGLGAR